MQRIWYKAIIIIMFSATLYIYSNTPTATVAQLAKPSEKTTAPFYKTILENAQLLVNIIEQEHDDPLQRKRAEHAIIINQKKLPSYLQKKIRPHTSTIIKISKKYGASRQHKDPEHYLYDALSSLTTIIAEASETESNAIALQDQQSLEQNIFAIEKAVDKAYSTIESINKQLVDNSISPEQATHDIKKQLLIISSAEKELTNNIEQKKNRFFDYDYSEAEKNNARIVIGQLQKAIDQENRTYARTKNQKSPQDWTYAVHREKIEALNNEIYKQKIITGDVMSPQKKLFWATVAAAGVIIAGYLAFRRSNTLQEPIQDEKTPKPDGAALSFHPVSTTTPAPNPLPAAALIPNSNPTVTVSDNNQSISTPNTPSTPKHNQSQKDSSLIDKLKQPFIFLQQAATMREQKIRKEHQKRMDQYALTTQKKTRDRDNRFDNLSTRQILIRQEHEDRIDQYLSSEKYKAIKK